MPDASTRLAVLLGDPVAHSLSPLLHNAAFRAAGLSAVYLACRVAPEDLGAAVAGLRALGALGANVTIPHKQAVAAHLDALLPAAEAIGAVNTIVPEKGGRLLGANTDAAGFLAGIEGLGLEGQPALIFGSGGAARAVAYALLREQRPASLVLAVRNVARGDALAADFAGLGAIEVVPLAEAGPAIRASRLVVNATPLGMHPREEETVWPSAEDFSPEQTVYDLVYRPVRTRLLREAAARGARTVDGLAMLLGQAAAAFTLWTGREMPLDAVHAALTSWTDA